jgi:carboxyl-terminal processing protease
MTYSKDVGETALDNPLPWDTIQPVTYDKFNLVQPYIAMLTTNSNERVATNQDFLYVKQDIAEFLKAQADGTATINEHEALKDHERAFREKQAQDAERSARKPDGIKVYDVTVENADLPGLTEASPTTDNDAQTVETVKYGANTPVVFTNLDGNIVKYFGTNTVTANTSATGTNMVESVAAKKSPPPFDPMLDETERILLDYISLLGKKPPLIANQ